MKVKRILFIIFIVFITGIALSVQVLNMKINTDVDMVAVNEVVKTIESRWGVIELGDNSAIEQQFVVLDNNGNVLYQTAMLCIGLISLAYLVSMFVARRIKKITAYGLIRE